MRPDNWDDIVKGAKINDDYLELLDTKVSVSLGKGSAYNYGINRITLTKNYFGKTNATKVLAHEFGHAIHHQRGWVTSRGYVNPLIREMIEKHKKSFKIAGETADQQIERLRRKFYFGNTTKKRMSKAEYDIYDDFTKFMRDTRKKFPGMSEKVFLENFTAMTDYMGGLFKGKAGWGHSMAYMARSNKGAREVFAHMMENKFVGNPVFKKLYPKIYKESIETLEALIKQYKLKNP